MYNYQIMNNSFGYIDIILLGMIAGFIILRLRSILGRKTGHETKVYQNFEDKKFNISNNIIKPIKQNHEILEGNPNTLLVASINIKIPQLPIINSTGKLNFSQIVTVKRIPPLSTNWS